MPASKPSTDIDAVPDCLGSAIVIGDGEPERIGDGSVIWCGYTTFIFGLRSFATLTADLTFCCCAFSVGTILRQNEDTTIGCCFYYCLWGVLTELSLAIISSFLM